jgi:HEPN domain-containing protein
MSSSDSDWLLLLKESDQKSLAGRLERLPLVYLEPDRDGYQIFVGGTVSQIAYGEARLAYLHGVFLGAILLAQTCLEHMLAAVFYGAGDDTVHKLSYKELLHRAKEKSHLTADEWQVFETLRTLRNPYAHSRPPASDEGLPARAIAAEQSIPGQLEEDAATAVSALMALMRRPPFFIPIS